VLQRGRIDGVIVGNIANDTLSVWREEGLQRILQNQKEFRDLFEQAKGFMNYGNYLAAAVYGEMAAYHATAEHSGFFVNQELEKILIDIGQQALSTDFKPRKKVFEQTKPNKVLHVLTSVRAIGGHTKMLCRWIQQDAERTHSVVLTRQELSYEVPQNLKSAVKDSRGKICLLNQRIGNLISWAKQLQKISHEFDLVVLHVHNYDVIPIIAFANKEKSPPIIFLDHADHKFWLGASISDIVVNLRESGRNLSQTRRGIESSRSCLLPTLVEPANRKMSRQQAKRQLNISEDSILLVSIARSVKYRTIDGTSFIEAHIPLLKEHKNAFLLVVGPGNRADWSAAIKQLQGRIKVLNETKDTAIFYQAADIYIDSFPFVSNTSLLEAGSYGIPLVSRFPYSDTSEILGADMPGLTGKLIWTRNIKDYTEVLSHLIEDEKFRESLGEATKKKISELHFGSNWQDNLESIYNQAISTSKLNDCRIIQSCKDQTLLGEPDVFLPIIHGNQDNSFNHDWLYQINMGSMPLFERWHQWKRLRTEKSLALGFTSLLPEWLQISYSNFKMKTKNQIIKYTSKLNHKGY
jgi:glycosyltransferase involved in cell wall biosynthesis